MTLSRLLLRSLWRFRRTNLGVLLGVAVATTVITGALIVGDSMRYTLQHTADQRLGKASHAVITGERFFTTHLSSGLAENGADTILLTGVLSTPDGKARVNDVAVTGIDNHFRALMGGPTAPEPGKATLNRALMRRLGVSHGDTIILRVTEPSALPIDAALVNASTQSLALRMTVAGTVDDDAGGNFSLRAEQRTPLNLFVNRAWLAEQLDLTGRANALLLNGNREIHPTLADLELDLTTLDDGRHELNTPRVFIDASIEDDLADLPGQRLLTYMVNTIERGEKQSPYAMICAADGLGDLQLADNEIAINRWLADDIDAHVGSTIRIEYYLPDEGNRLTEASAELTVARIVEIEGPFADRSLTPDFPGLAEAESLRGWESGPAIDESRIRNEDEAYWDEYRATPKAFINLATGQRLWSNRFGTLTAIRFDADVTSDQLTQKIDPKPLGFTVIDIRAQASQAAKGTVDFGQLFLSLSGFIIIASVVLTATLFAMSVEQRARQLGVLLAVGLTRGQVTTLIVGEGAVVGIGGALLGLVGGVWYAQTVTGALAGVWSGAVAGTPVMLHQTTTSLLAGPISALVISVVAMLLAMRALVRRPARELLAGAIGKVSGRPRLPVWAWLVSAGVLVVPTVLLAKTGSGMVAALAGFGAGASLLALLLCLLTALLVAWTVRARKSSSSTTRTPARLTAQRLALRNLVRRRGRTLAAVITLSCGVFLVLAVAGFRLGTTDDPTDRASGTGGFALIVESTQPIRYDLNTRLGRDHYFYDEDDLPTGSVVALRVNGGDDASCLNLNQTPRPRLLGVDAKQLEDREAFTFFPPTEGDKGWALLTSEPDSDAAIPAIADANTAQWALKLPVGGTMTLTDETGQPFTIRLVATLDNSILQGSLIVDERAFERLYPSTSGHRMLLVDASDEARRDEVASLLGDVLEDEGVTITPTTDRLAEFNTVQNTYLTIFQALGGLGVVLGALGLGVITARNLLERRAELALMSAVGIGRARIVFVTLIEHGLVLGSGLVLGLLGAWAATLHTGRGLADTGGTAAITLGAALFAGLCAVALGLKPALSRRLTDTLRND